MEWIIIFLTILTIGYFVYTAIQKRNDIEQKELELKQKQLEQKERELELNPEYRKQQVKELYDNSISQLKDQVTLDEIKLRKAEKEGSKEYIKEAKRSLAYSRSQLKMFQRASKSALSDVK